jgi:hypothetical protein
VLNVSTIFFPFMEWCTLGTLTMEAEKALTVRIFRPWFISMDASFKFKKE